MTTLLSPFKEGIKIAPAGAVVHDTLKMMVLAFLAFFLTTYLIWWITPTSLYAHIFVLGKIGDVTILYCFPSIANTIAFSLIFIPIWWKTLKEENYYGLVAFMVAILFGVTFATVLDVAFQPSASTVKSKYVFYIGFAQDILKMATMVAVIPLWETIVRYTYKIFSSNLQYSLRSALAGFAGGIFGFVVVGLMAVFCTGFIFGCTVGIILRNTIAGAPSLLHAFASSLLVWFAALGLPPFWHTFWEFLAFATIGIFAAIAGYALFKRNLKYLKTAVGGGMLGVLFLFTGSFTEVTVDAGFVKLIAPLINFSPTLVDVTVGATYFLTLITTLISTALMLLLAAWLINYLLAFLQEYVVFE